MKVCAIRKLINAMNFFFKLQTCGDHCANLSFDDSTITLKMNELNYLLLNIGTIETSIG
jgi:hypothetical protein